LVSMLSDCSHRAAPGYKAGRI